MKSLLMICIGVHMAATIAAAANLAYDDAADAAYSGGWTNGSNGGYGFGPWQLVVNGSSAGFFIGSSTQNWDSSDDGFLNGAPGDGDIDSSGVAWGMFAEPGGNTASAIRPFTGGPLGVGQSFSVEFDNGDMFFAALQTFALLDSLLNPVFTVASGPFADYEVTDAGGTFSSGLSFGSEGVLLSFIMTDVTSYQAGLTRPDGGSASWTGTVSAAPVAFRAEGTDVGIGTPFYFYINNMSIVPEPSAAALWALGAASFLSVALFRRSRRAS